MQNRHCLTSSGGATFRWNDEPPHCVGTVERTKKCTARRTSAREFSEDRDSLPNCGMQRPHLRLTVVRVRVPVILDPLLRRSDLGVDRGGIRQRLLRLELTTSLERVTTPDVAGDGGMRRNGNNDGDAIEGGEASSNARRHRTDRSRK